MLIPRIIPCLLMNQGAMLKTIGFSRPIYLGNPLNVINLFNEFEVDEVVLLDIGASIGGKDPDFALIKDVAEECWIPLTYGGGISSIEHVERLIRSGCEKVVIGTAVTSSMKLVTEIAKEFGSQCVVGSVDSKRTLFSGYRTFARSASLKLNVPPDERALQFEESGAGEILLQSIDRDGEMTDYDTKLISLVSEAISIPLTACGGASRRDQLVNPIKVGASASAAGSIFVFSGIERGVNINFPERMELESILSSKVLPS